MKKIAALRTLGSVDFGDRSAFESLRVSYLRHENFRVRQASLYALGKIAAGESWFLDQSLPHFLQIEASESVHRAAVVVASELIPFSQTSQSQSFFKHYLHGVELARSFPPECLAPAGLDEALNIAITSLRRDQNAFQMFLEGFGVVFSDLQPL